ncbi:MAG: hypothetical protein Q9187_005670 [Circinaria calcarea]
MLNRQLRLIQNAIAFRSFAPRTSDVRIFSKSQQPLQIQFLQTAPTAQHFIQLPQGTCASSPGSHQTVTVGDGNLEDTQLAQSEVRSTTKQTVGKGDGPVLKAVKSGRRKFLRPQHLAASKPKDRLTGTARQISQRLRRFQIRMSAYREQTTRTKYVSLRHNPAVRGGDSSTDRSSYTDEFSSRWTTAFAHVSAPYDRILQRDMKFKIQSTRTRVTQAVEGSIMQSWSAVRKRRKRFMWRKLMLRALRLSPIDALMIMDDTLTKGQYKPPRYCMEDSLDLITCRLLEIDNVQGHMIESLHSSVCNFISTYSSVSGIASISQRTIFLLSKCCSFSHLSSLWVCLREHNVFIHLNTKMQLASLLLDHGRVESALDILRGLNRSELALDQVQSVCVRLLRLYLDIDNIYAVRSSMLAQLLMLGLRPNIYLYNVILLNAMEAGDRRTAWRIYQTARDHDLEPNAYTYTILFKGAGDKATLEAIRRDAYNDGIDIKKDPRLATEYFYALYLGECNGPQNWSFRALLSRYRDFFKTSSLHELGIPVGAIDIPQVEDLEKLDPPPPALGIMIMFYLRRFRDNSGIPVMYDTYLRLVRDRHAVIAPLAMTTHTANAFLMALGWNLNTLHLCPSVLEHMMGPRSSDNEEVSNEQPDPDTKQMQKPASWMAPPDVQTWSILLYAFLRHGQVTAAEKVLSMMRSRKQWPSQVTWSSLVSGYSRLQNADGAVHGLRRMERDGFQPSDRTIAGLGHIVDRKKLIEAFRKASQNDEPVVQSGISIENENGTTT